MFDSKNLGIQRIKSITLNQFVDFCRGRLSVHDCVNLVWFNDGTIKVNSFELHDINNNSIPKFSKKFLPKYLSPITVIPVAINRGCYASCSFCNYHTGKSGKWREMKIENTIYVISELKKLYNTKYFFFAVATIPPSSLLKMCNGIINKRLSIKWSAGLRLDPAFANDLIKIMKKSGCRRVDLGVESFNKRVLKLMNKKVNSDNFKEIISCFYRENIFVYTYFIKDFPGEKHDEYLETIKFIIEIKDYISGFSIYPFILSKHSPIFMDPDNYGIVIKNKNEYINDLSVVPEFHWILEKKNKDDIELFLKKSLDSQYYNIGYSFINKMTSFLNDIQLQSKTITIRGKKRIMGQYLYASKNCRILRTNKLDIGIYNEKNGNYIYVSLEFFNKYFKKNIPVDSQNIPNILKEKGFFFD